MSAPRFVPDERFACELSAEDALVLYECLARYQESDPQELRPNASEYLALMHVLGAAQRWVEGHPQIQPEDYAATVAEAYELLSEPAGYRGEEPPGPRRSSERRTSK
jgi:hypothetical protein